MENRPLHYASVLQLAAKLQAQQLRICCAESCTGGMIAAALTDVPGSSNWFSYGLVTYSNFAKQRFLGVEASTLEKYGAVSQQVVTEMARGALQCGDAEISIAVSGIAGPGGARPGKEVGTVWIAVASAKQVVSDLQVFPGDRQSVRNSATMHCLQQSIKFISDLSSF